MNVQYLAVGEGEEEEHRKSVCIEENRYFNSERMKIERGKRVLANRGFLDLKKVYDRVNKETIL